MFGFRRSVPMSSKVFALVAVVLGSLAFLVVRAERARFEALGRVTGPPVTVVVMRSSVDRGAVIVDAALEIRRIPGAFVPPGAMTSTDDAVGKVLAADVAEGEVLTRTRLVAAGAGPLAGLVPEGMRAMGISVTVPDGLRSGDRVDVLATFSAEGHAYTETVGHALEVMRVGAPTSGLTAASGEPGAPTLTVLATPDVAERLAYALAFASVQVAVVGPDEVGTG